MGDYDLGVGLQARFNSAGFPIPKDDISCRVPATYPLAIRRESDLTSISSNRVTSKMLFPVLAEVVGAVN